MRLFVSIEIPRKIKEKMAPLISELEKAGVTPVKQQEQLHCTLCFLGEVPESELPAIKKALLTVQFKEFSIDVASIGAFPSLKNPSVIWVGLKSCELNTLAKEVALALKVESRPFVAHCTLARVKTQGVNLGFLQKYSKIRFGTFILRSFELKKSALSSKGAKHEILFSLRNSSFCCK